jgi:hypothetical protein
MSFFGDSTHIRNQYLIIKKIIKDKVVLLRWNDITKVVHAWNDFTIYIQIDFVFPLPESKIVLSIYLEVVPCTVE